MTKRQSARGIGQTSTTEVEKRMRCKKNFSKFLLSVLRHQVRKEGKGVGGWDDNKVETEVAQEVVAEEVEDGKDEAKKDKEDKKEKYLFLSFSSWSSFNF